MLKILLFVVGLLSSTSRLVDGHGRLIDPPNRSSIWRYTDQALISPYVDIIESNYNDNQLFCGGRDYQISVSGQCGVCGDPYGATDPENEAGGKYAKGIIVAQYAEGSWIDVTVEITTHHQGYFEFRLCQWDDVLTRITHDCLNQNLLDVTSVGNKQYDITNYYETDYAIRVKLPAGITCDQCVLQWRYHTGNTWGCDNDGTCGTGHGPQEEFYGCADIAIGTDPIVPPPGYPKESTSTSQVTSSTKTSSPSSTISTTSSSTTTTTSSALCSGGDGYYAIDCTYYYRCMNGISYTYQCSPGTAFNPQSNICDYPSNVPSCG